MRDGENSFLHHLRTVSQTLQYMKSDRIMILVTYHSSVSLDCQYFDREKEKFRVIKSNKVVDPNKEVIVVLSNLAVRRDRRKQKIAQKLLQACENYIRVSALS